MCLVATLGLIALGSQTPRDLTQRVTFDSGAKTITRALEALSKTTGVSFSASGQTGKYPVFVYVRDVPLRELMDKLAEATAFEWQKEGEGYRLVLTATRAREQERASFERRVAAIERAQNSARVQAERRTPFDDAEAALYLRQLDLLYTQVREQDPKAWEAIGLQQRKGPCAALALRLGSMLDPKILADADYGEKVAFSNAPTKMQHPLPAEAKEAISSFEQEMSRMMSAAGRTFGADAVQRLTQFNVIQGGPVAGGFAPDKVLVTVTSYGGLYGYEARVFVADRKGRILVQDSAHIRDYGLANSSPSPSTKREAEVEIPERAASFIARIRSRGGGSPIGMDLTAEETEGVLNPERIEPFGFLASDILGATSRAKGANIVAALHDWTPLVAAWAVSQGTKSPSMLLSAIASRRGAITVSEPNGWIIVAPTDPVKWREDHIDRRALGQLARSVAASRRFSLEALAAYAIKSPRGEAGSNGLMIAAFLVRDEPDYVGGTEFDKLRFHGGFSPGERQALLRGQRIPVRALSPVQRALIERLFYSSRDYELERTAAPGLSQEQIRDWLNSIFREPSESLPNGIPASATVSLAASENEVVFASQSSGKGRTHGTIEVYGLAQQLLAEERPAEFPWFQANRFDTYQPGRQVWYRYRIDLADGLVKRIELSDSIREGSKVKSIADLPAPWKAKIDEKLAELRKLYDTKKPPPTP